MANLNHTDSTKQLCVSKVPFFNHLKKDEMVKVVQTSRSLRFTKGEIIHHADDILNELLIVHKGKVKIYQIFESGKEQLLRILKPGEFMGELAIFSEKRLDSYAEALEQTEICAIHRKDMTKLMEKHPTIAIKILEQFSKRLDLTEQLVGQNNVMDVEARTASLLLQLRKDEGTSTFMLPMSKKDMASYLATSQETLSRKLTKFQENGWINQKGHRYITVIDDEALEKVASRT